MSPIYYNHHKAEGMILGVIRALAAAATATLAISSGRNAWQTSRAAGNPSGQSCSLGVCSVEQRVDDLQQWRRKEILSLFFGHTRSPTLEEMQGEWNGVLLPNGVALTTATRFLTHVCFGRGRQWNGKTFGNDGLGTNRFYAQQTSGLVQLDQPFTYQRQPSRLDPLFQVVALDYTSQRTKLSPWHSMRDELRVLDLPHSDGEIVLGLGCMAWSGGMLNASPFLLWRKTTV